MELEDRLARINWESIWDSYDESPIPTFLISKTGEIMRYNQAMVKLTGYSHDEMSRIENYIEKLHPDPQDRKHIVEMTVLSQTRHKAFSRYEVTITTKAGEPRYVAFSVTDLKDRGRYLNLQIVQIEDVTERVAPFTLWKRASTTSMSF